MKKIYYSVVLAASLLIFGCGAPTNSNSQPANAQNANLAVTPSPVAASSPGTDNSTNSGQTNTAEADFPEIVSNIHKKVNEFRRSQGLAPLELEPVISRQAREHSREMAENPDTISHRKFDDRVADIKNKLTYSAAAENVAVNLNYPNPGEQAVEGWIKSDSHRKNMLGDYTKTGIGVFKTDRDRYFFTQIYWKP